MNMGMIYADQGDYPKALELYQQSLQIEERLKGKGCNDSASTLCNIKYLFKGYLQLNDGWIIYFDLSYNIGDLYMDLEEYYEASSFF